VFNNDGDAFEAVVRIPENSKFTEVKILVTINNPELV
jgi:hypothetical protein